MIAVRYFARVREALGRSGDDLPLPGDPDRPLTVAELVGELRARDPSGWSRLPANQPLLYAVNRQMVPASTVVREGDELAVFPPVTGG